MRQAVHLLATIGVKFEPDLVVLMIVDSHRAPLDHGTPDAMDYWLTEHSALWRWAHRRFEFIEVGGDEDEEGPDGEDEMPDPTDTMRQALRQLLQLKRQLRFEAAIFEIGDTSEYRSMFEGQRLTWRALRALPESASIPGDGHPNAQGHALLARDMAERLIEDGLVRRVAPPPTNTGR